MESDGFVPSTRHASSELRADLHVNKSNAIKNKCRQVSKNGAVPLVDGSHFRVGVREKARVDDMPKEREFFESAVRVGVVTRIGSREPDLRLDCAVLA